MTPTNDDGRSSDLAPLDHWWNSAPLPIVLLSAIAVAGFVAVETLRSRAWQREIALHELRFDGRRIAQAVLTDFNDMMETEWPVPENERFVRAMKTTARKEGQPLAEMSAELDRYAHAVRNAKIEGRTDLICAAVAEGRLDLAAEEAQRAAREAISAPAGENRNHEIQDDTAIGSEDTVAKLLELAASTLVARGQNDRALLLLTAALNLADRDRDVRLWAEIETEIGYGHLRIARHLASRDGRDHLDQGIAALRLAEETGQDDFRSSDGSLRLFRLGSALLDRAERCSIADAEPFAEEATHVLRCSLDAQSRKDTPLEWITAKQKLVEAQSKCAPRRSAQERMSSALRTVESIRTCAERIDRVHETQEWATAQTELGVALLRLATCGKGKADCDLIEDAIAAHHTALEGAQRSNEPLVWALVQGHLASAFSRLGDEAEANDRAVDLYKEAAAACRASLEVITQEQAPIAWAKAELDLSLILSSAAKRSVPESGAFIAEAQSARSAALGVLTEAGFPQL